MGKRQSARTPRTTPGETLGKRRGARPSGPKSEREARPQEAAPGAELQEPEATGDVFQIIRDLEDQLAGAYEMQEALTRDRDALSEEATVLRRANEEQKRRLRYLEEKIPDLETLRRELEFAEEERSRAQNAAQALKEELETKSREAAAHAEALAAAKAQLKETKAASLKMEFELGQLRERKAEFQRLEKEHQALRQQYDEAASKTDELESAVEQSVVIRSQLEEGLREAKETIQRLQADRSRLEKSNLDLERQGRESQAYAAALERDAERLKAKSSKLEEDLAASRDEARRLEAELVSTRKTMKEIHTALAGTKAKSRRIDSDAK